MCTDRRNSGFDGVASWLEHTVPLSPKEHTVSLFPKEHTVPLSSKEQTVPLLPKVDVDSPKYP